MTSTQRLFIVSIAMAFSACTSSSEPSGTATAALVATCDADADPEADPQIEWVCPNARTVECVDGGADPEEILFLPPEERPEGCEGFDFTLEDEGPFEVGMHDIVIQREEPEEVLCEAKLTVQDTKGPEEVDEPIELWPPNHKFHTITGADCVKDLCDSDSVEVTFTHVTSDEPVNATGDGNTEPDIIVECDRVELRAERQGPSDGRVYELHWIAIDDAGNPGDGVCTVYVPHDQSGREVIDSGDAYEVLAPEECEDGAGGAGGGAGDGGAGGNGGTGGDISVP